MRHEVLRCLGVTVVEDAVPTLLGFAFGVRADHVCDVEDTEVASISVARELLNVRDELPGTVDLVAAGKAKVAVLGGELQSGRLAGRRWGAKIIELWAPGEFAKRFTARIQLWPNWALPLVVAAAALPGVPAPAVFAVAGLGQMRLIPFLIFGAVGTALMVGLVAGLGHGVGQHAVDVLLLIDEYALWITLAMVAVVALRAGYRAQRQDQEAKKAGSD